MKYQCPICDNIQVLRSWGEVPNEEYHRCKRCKTKIIKTEWSEVDETLNTRSL